MHEVLERIGEHRIVPILAGVEDPVTVLPVCDAVRDGGLPVLEITLRTPAAAEALRLAATERPGMLLAAGTVLTLEQAQQAVDAGAHLLVSPGLDPALVQFGQEAGIPITPGVSTPTEVQLALKQGVETAKFFPATTMGGAAAIKLMAGPFPSMKFVATGGIKPAVLEEYLALPNLLACGGTWMFGKGPAGEPSYEEITRRTRDTVAMVARQREASQMQGSGTR